MKPLVHRLALMGAALAVCAVVLLGAGDDEDQLDFAVLFDEIHALVAHDFVDPKLNGLDWEVIGAEFREREMKARDVEEFAAIANEMLSRLNTSHTHLYTEHEPAYFQLLSIFRRPLADQIRAAHPDNPELKYPGVGMFTTEIEGQTFIRGVLEGAPAHRAGLRVGDRIISVEGAPFHPIESFRQRVGMPTAVQIQRLRDETLESHITLNVVPEMLEPAAMLLLLRKRDRSPNELRQAFQLSQPAISQHLRTLRMAGLVAQRRQGKGRVYRIVQHPLRAVSFWLSQALDKA